MVYGIGRLGLAGRLDYQNETAFLQEQAKHVSVGSDLIGCLGEVALPYTELSRLFGFTFMPLEFLPVLVGILFLYIVTAEIAKKIFYGKVRF